MSASCSLGASRSISDFISAFVSSDETILLTHDPNHDGSRGAGKYGEDAEEAKQATQASKATLGHLNATTDCIDDVISGYSFSFGPDKFVTGCRTGLVSRKLFLFW